MAPPRLSLAVASLALSLAFLTAGCGAEKQDRPIVVSTFPADGAFVPGWLAAARITFDDAVVVLNERAASCSSEGDDGGDVSVRVVPDPSDLFSVLVFPANGGHFTPGVLHHLTIHEGAVVNREQHYALDETRFEFTLGPRPNLFVTTEDGAVHEVEPLTGASVSTTLPPAGFLARTPFGTDQRVWVWLDPVAPGSSALGTFVPGDAAITEIVALSGETGTVTGGLGMVLSLDGRTLYTTAGDAGTNRAFVHRIDVASRTEIAPSLMLSPALAGPTTFGLALDIKGNHLFVPFSDGSGGGLMAVVDEIGWVELDAGPGLGVDALPIEDGAGNAAYEPEREHVYMVLSNAATAGIVRLNADSDPLDVSVGTEPTVGTATTVLPLPGGGSVLYGLKGYADREGVVRASAGDVDSGTEILVADDVGAGTIGADRVVALLLDPGDRRFLVFVENGSTTVLAIYDWDGDGTQAVDFDDGVDGTQSLDLGPALGGSIATGATTLTGAYPP